MPEPPAALRAWYSVAETKNAALLDDLLADDVVFRSPAMFTSPLARIVTGVFAALRTNVTTRQQPSSGRFAKFMLLNTSTPSAGTGISSWMCAHFRFCKSLAIPWSSM